MFDLIDLAIQHPRITRLIFAGSFVVVMFLWFVCVDIPYKTEDDEQ